VRAAGSRHEITLPWRYRGSFRRHRLHASSVNFWPANHGAGCLNGTYVFKTDQLLEQSWYTGQVFLAGALRINNALTLRYTSPYSRPLMDYPPVSQGTITLDLKRVGAVSLPFNYQAINVLGPIAQCTL
jgi:hypothetical protein